ncbi:MAG: rhodanese-like domain-containing protein [Alphaproteobacteria bacterium]|nr:rhodanese-like domain-containing protein [Alphaproteobacteria bacterium]
MSWLSSLFGGGSDRIDGTEARRLVAEGALLIDVRSPGEFASGHIQGAKNIPVQQLGARLAEVNVGKTVVLYCASGARSASAQGMLAGQGITAFNLGPMSAW